MREQWQIDQGNRCPCRGADEYCVCQNVNKAEAEIVEGRSRYIQQIFQAAEAAMEKAVIKFPQPNYVGLKVAEEAGEVVKAAVHYAEDRETWENVEAEVIQMIAMGIRLLIEGDQKNGIIPPHLKP